MKRLRTLLQESAWSVAILVLFLAVWEFLVRYLEIPTFVLPAPSQIPGALLEGLMQPFDSAAGFYVHTAYTLGEALTGFFLGSALGIVMGTLISQSRFIERVVFPYILALQCLPKVAIAPLLVVWFGTGFSSKVVIVSLLCFFPLLVNSIAGFESVNRDQVDLMRSFRATSWQIFRKVKFPNALPFIFAGLNMAVIYSLIGALVGEFLGARRGLGAIILQMNFNLDMPGVFAVFVILAAIGMFMYGTIRAVERRVTFWTRRTDNLVGL